MANIGATTAFYKVETSLTRANNEVSKSMERLATGKQNANAGDRSSYVAMADTFRLDFVGTKAGIKGASVVMGYLETGMRVLDSASALLARLQELAVLGANDTNTTADHEAINLEAEAIADEFNRLMTTSTYKGRDVFNDTANALYVSMGGRDQEMTFGVGRIDYSDLYQGTAQTIAAATSSSNGPNMGTDFNLAHLPSDAVVIKDTGKATSTGISGRTSGLSAGTSTKTYIITSLDNDSTTHPNGTNYGLGDNVTAGDQALAANPTLKAGETYRITGLNRDTTGATTDLDTADGTHLNATAIGGASTNMVDNAGAAATVLAVGVRFEMTADYTVADADLAIKRVTTKNSDADGTFAEFREIDASQITRNIESVQKKINKARVQAGSQYAAMESAVIYTTDLTAQYELGYNTVHDVNFSMETAHLAKNQILQQAATAMLAQANQGQQGLLQLIQG